MTRHRLTPVLCLFLTCALAAGCGGGKSSRSSASTVAPSTSGTNGSPGPVSSSSAGLPSPGGTIAGVVTATTPVNASLNRGIYQTFQEQASVSDVVVPAALRDRAFVVEDNGVVRVLDISGPNPRLDRAINLGAARLPAGAATGLLEVQDAQTALLVSSGQGNEAVFLFNPSTARTEADVTRYDLSPVTITWAAGTQNSKGVDVGGRALPLTYTASAVVSGGRLIFCSSNLDAAFDLNPGAVVAFGLHPTTRVLSGGAVQRTSCFNPTGLTRVATARGELVLCTNTGPYGTGPSSIDVLEPAGFRLLGSIPLGAVNATGKVVVSPDGRRGYVASQSAAEVYVLDLAGLDAELTNLAPRDMTERALGGWGLPSTASTSFVSGIGLSHTGNYLYAVNMNESALWVVDLTQPGVAAHVVGFARSGNPGNFEGLANRLAVRPGTPGVDFQGPSIFVATINLATADQTVRNVKVALDGVTVDRH